MAASDPRSLVLLYSDESVLLAGASGILSSAGLFEVALAEPDLSGLIPHARLISPDVILLDVTADMTLGIVSELRKASSSSRIVLWSRHLSEEFIDQAGGLGNVCFLGRNCSKAEFIKAIANAAPASQDAGHNAPTREGSTKVNLTVREAQLVTLLVQGLRNKEIAACLGITEGTVRIYLTKLFVKVGARDRFELAVFGLKNAYCGQAFWDGENSFVTEGDESRARPMLRSLLLIKPKRLSGYDAPAEFSELPRASGQ